MTTRGPLVVSDWTIERDGALKAAKFQLPCGHVVFARMEWFADDGRLVGRLGCSALKCRAAFDDVVLARFAEVARG